MSSDLSNNTPEDLQILRKVVVRGSVVIDDEKILIVDQWLSLIDEAIEKAKPKSSSLFDSHFKNTKLGN